MNTFNSFHAIVDLSGQPRKASKSTKVTILIKACYNAQITWCCSKMQFWVTWGQKS